MCTHIHARVYRLSGSARTCTRVRSLSVSACTHTHVCTGSLLKAHFHTCMHVHSPAPRWRRGAHQDSRSRSVSAAAACTRAPGPAPAPRTPTLHPPRRARGQARLGVPSVGWGRTQASKRTAYLRLRCSAAIRTTQHRAASPPAPRPLKLPRLPAAHWAARAPPRPAAPPAKARGPAHQRPRPRPRREGGLAPARGAWPRPRRRAPRGI